MTRLRRLLQPVNWAYALGEFLLIVMGVLVALGANAAWEGREDRARERAYLRQLRTDAEETRRRLDAAIAEEEGARAAAEAILAALQASGPLHEDSVRAWIAGRPFWYADPRPVLGTITALQQSGDLGLLRSDSLRVAVSAYANEMETDQVEFGRFVDTNNDHTMRFIEAGTRAVRQYRADAPGWDEHVLFVLTLRDDPELRAIFAVVHTSRAVRLIYLERMRAATDRLLRVVDGAEAGSA